MTLGPLMVGIRGTAPTAEEIGQLRHPLTGGVILFKRNIESAQQVAELNRELHALRKPELLLAVDQEGGRVQRLTDGFTPLPPLGALGSLFDRDPRQAVAMAEAHAWVMASEVRAAGFDFSFAPVLDLDRVSTVIGKRAFHAEPEIVSALGRRYVQSMHDAGMAAVGKHFPGHGSVIPDSHLELPRDDRPLKELMRTDLIPFAELIHHGLNGIMASHVIYSQIDGACAGFSRRWIADILRGRLAFQGAVFSDDLSMAAAEAAGDCSTRARQALAAGCDMAIVAEPGALPELLRRLEHEGDPARQSRLLRMRGRGHVERGRLRKSLAWRKAVARLSELAGQTEIR